MEPGAMLRVIMIVTGVLLFCITLSSLAKRRLTEPFCMTWGLVSVIIILAGVLLRPDEWNRYISPKGMLMVVMIGFCVVYGMLFMSTKVSALMRRNQELAMQVSLLKHENDNMQEKLEELCKLWGEQTMHPDGQEKEGREAGTRKARKLATGEWTAKERTEGKQTAGERTAKERTEGEQTAGERIISGQTVKERTERKQAAGERTVKERTEGEQTTGEQMVKERTAKERTEGKQTGVDKTWVS